MNFKPENAMRKGSKVLVYGREAKVLSIGRLTTVRFTVTGETVTVNRSELRPIIRVRS